MTMDGDEPGIGPDGFVDAYEGRPPWEVGDPQPAVVDLADAGRLQGSILDVGCGTGENALMLAEHGYEVVGIDSAPNEIERARAKARERGVDVEFLTLDAYELASLDRSFDTVVDSALFHVLAHEDPDRYAASVRSAIRDGGRLFVLAFESGQEADGPSIPREAIQATFQDGWMVQSIETTTYETIDPDVYKRRALLATIEAT
jgi:cyclopropane fatty-acyl-phospholipid synthase-like methyltransferase